MHNAESIIILLEWF